MTSLNNHDHRRTALAFMCVTYKTAYSYCSCLHGITKYGYQLTNDGVETFAEEHAHKMTSGTIGQYRNAWTHYRRIMVCVGMDRAADRTNAVLEASKITLACAETKIRGSITQDMAKKLVERAAVKKHPEIRDLFILLSASGVRSNQLHLLRLSHCYEDEDHAGVRQFSVVKNHKGRGKILADATEIHHTNPFWAHP